MNKEKVFIEGYEIGSRIDTLGTKEKIIQVSSGETVSIDENFIYKSIEQEKVTIPQDVADWIEYCKVRKITLAQALYRSEEAKNKSVYRWIVESLNHQETFALAWIFGYKIDKEKRYIATLKSSGQKLYYHTEDEDYIFSSYDGVFYSEYHTKTDLEENGMSWVFDSPGIEVEEVGE